MTDHGNMFGAYEFYQAGQGARDQADHRHRGLRRARHAAGSTASRVRWGRAAAKTDDVSGGGAYTHMTHAGPQTTEGLHNLFRLSSLASLEGYFYKPADGPRAARRATRTGIIATTGCPSGEVQTRLRLGQYDEALAGRRGVPGHLRRRTTTSWS